MQWKHWPSVPVVLLIAAVAAPGPLAAEQLESFTEPYKSIAIPASEIGVIAKILVAEGDQVSKRQVLAQLDDSVLTSSLAVARAAKEALGSRRAAEAELELRTRQLESYRQLRGHKNATQRELDRAESDHLQAQARLQSVREELEVRRLEYERVKAQIEQRRMESPINGFVVKIVKEVGEFVSPTDPIVMHVVQLDTLTSEFSVPMPLAKEIKAGQSVTLLVGYDRTACSGVVEFVSPVADPKSATVSVKIRIPNRDGKVASGAACHWNLKTETPVERVSRSPDAANPGRR
jgi:RND family efflux transporter MFP subunit